MNLATSYDCQPNRGNLKLLKFVFGHARPSSTIFGIRSETQKSVKTILAPVGKLSIRTCCLLSSFKSSFKKLSHLPCHWLMDSLAIFNVYPQKDLPLSGRVIHDSSFSSCLQGSRLLRRKAFSNLESSNPKEACSDIVKSTRLANEPSLSCIEGRPTRSYQVRLA